MTSKVPSALTAGTISEVDAAVFHGETVGGNSRKYTGKKIASRAWSREWFPKDNEAPSSNYATLDTRNSHPTLDYDTTTQEIGMFRGFLSRTYGGNGVTVGVVVALTSATSG